MTTRPIQLAEAQHGVLAAQLIDPSSAAFTVGEEVVLEAAPGTTLDDGRLRVAIARACAEATGMWLDLSDDVLGTAAALQSPSRKAVEVAFVDLSDRDDPDAAAREHLAAAMARPFDLGGVPLHEQTLLRLDERRRTWLFRAHHVILDGYAIHQVIRRALALYAGSAPEDAGWVHPDEVVAEQRHYLGSTDFERDRAAWAERLAGDPSPSPLLGSAGPAGPAVRCRAESRVSGAAVDAAAASLGATWADLAMTATALHLARHQARGTQGPADVVLGIPLMNRLGSAAARCPAMVTNVLPLRVAVDPMADLAGLVDRVAAAATALRRGGRYRAERLQRDLGLLVSGNPLTLAELNIKLFDAPVEVPGVTVTVRNLAEGPLDDLSLSVDRRPDGVTGWVASGPAGAAEDEVRGHLDGVTALFEEVVAAVSDPARRIVVGSLGAASGPGPSVMEGPRLPAWPDPAERFAQAVAAHAARTALVADGTTWSYRALDERVAAEAGRIRAAGAGVGDLVAVDLPRGAAYVVALLALHRIGSVAVVLDAEWPATRRREMLDRLRASYTLSELPDVAGPPVPAPVPVPADALAYVIHTSGSTGFPKAVGITRAGLGHFVAHHERIGLFAEAPADRRLRIGQTLALAFDGSWDTLQGVLLGHEVHLVDRDTGRDPAALRALLAADRIDLVDTVPSLVAALLDEGLLDDGQPAPSRISVGGEACSTTLWQRLRAHPGLRVLNLYGPTEFTVDALGATGADADQAVIGRPLADTTALVLDRHLHPVPAGVRGELYLAGVQEARGYLGQSGLTAERFVANPYGPPGSRMYRSGDVVSVGPDGLVRYHGRRDAQAKVRGFRVEPAEVEAALSALPGVSTAAVVAGDQRLLGYAVPGRGTTLEGTALRAALAERLPAHLVPAHVVVLDALPVTTTGKLDAAALPHPTVDPSARGRAPAGPAEEAVATAVTEVLPEAGAVGADSDFFALGGDSITAIRAVAALRRAGWTSSVRDVFRLRTLAGIAATAVRACDAGSTRPDAPAAPRSLVELDANQMGQLGDLLGRRTRRKASR